MPHAVRAERVARAVDQHRERQEVVAQPRANRIRTLREDRGGADVVLQVLAAVARQGAELAPAVRSPGAAVEGEQQPAATEEVVERVDVARRVRQ